jgi:hypothetical protein
MQPPPPLCQSPRHLAVSYTYACPPPPLNVALRPSLYVKIIICSNVENAPKLYTIIDAAKDPAHFKIFKIYTISVYCIHSDRIPYSRVKEGAANTIHGTSISA